MPPVVFIMIDGLRPDVITPERCPNLTRVLTRGASTKRATSVMPSITLPCHMSIFHSVPPTRHGVTTNDWQPMARPLPGLVDVARSAGQRCAFIYSWEPLRNLSQPGSLWSAHFRATADNLPDGDKSTATIAAQVIAEERPDFTFVYLATVDTSGHEYGWMSDGYLAQAVRVDGELGRVLAAVPDEGVVLIQSDHGGHERTHGTDAPDDMLIPWVIAGPGVKRGHALSTPVSLLDTAPTLARVLGLTPHPQWEGRCVDEAFE